MACRIDNNTKIDRVDNEMVGTSTYSKHPDGYTPWDLWDVYKYDPWDADIQKRLIRGKSENGRTKEDMRIEDYKKIITICKKQIQRIEQGVYDFRRFK